MEWELAPDIQKKAHLLIKQLSFLHLRPERIFCFRSSGSKSRAFARIWSLPRIWQKALTTPPAYCLEIISRRFDHLNEREQTKVFIHELLHIPKNFSGSLLSHRCQQGEKFNRKVERLFQSISSK